MIALTDGLPCLRLETGEITAFQRDWLVCEVRDAACRAGYANWWLAEHVAESVEAFLRDRFEENTLDVSRLSRAVRSVLQVIGYAEVATQFAPGLPPVHISLVEVARAAGAGYELAFFDLLNQRIHEHLAQDVSDLRLHGLERCVRHLNRRKIWCRECDLLRSEIVVFVREQIEAVGLHRSISFSLR